MPICADYGASDQLQVGLAIALPVNPGAGFGSILASASAAVDRSFAVRANVGFENVGFNGDNTSGFSHTSRYFFGLGAPVRIPISPHLAFVSGRTAAVDFGHFNNIGDGGTGLYGGASGLADASSDVLVFSAGNNDTSKNIGINLPAGLLLQPDPHLAVTLQAGYSVSISVPSSGGAQALHFIPVGLEAVVTPTPLLDIGARFFLNGYVAQTGGTSGLRTHERQLLRPAPIASTELSWNGRARGDVDPAEET